MSESLKKNKRLLKAYQEQREKNKYLALDYAQSEANGKSLNALLEQAGEQRKQLRKDFIEQSEIAVEWRQKHDKLKESFDSQKDYMKRTAASWNKLSNEVAQLEAELDRGNEMISWLKGDLEMAFNLLREAFKLLKEDCDAAQEVKIQELDHLFKNPFREKKPKGWNLKVYPRDEKGRAMKPMPKEGIMEVEFEESSIDWSKPQPFPKDYVVPAGIDVIRVDKNELSDNNDSQKKGRIENVVICESESDNTIVLHNSSDLAPINPTDHPLHPDFKDPDKQDLDPNSPNEIARNWDKLTPYPKGCIVPINEPSINVSSDNKLIKIGELGYLCQSKANYTKVWFYPIDSKLVQERTRRDYIECEVHNFAPTNPHHHPDHPFYGIPKEQLMLTPDGWKLKEDEKFISVNLSPKFKEKK